MTRARIQVGLLFLFMAAMTLIDDTEPHPWLSVVTLAVTVVVVVGVVERFRGTQEPEELPAGQLISLAAALAAMIAVRLLLGPHWGHVALGVVGVVACLALCWGWLRRARRRSFT